MHIADKRGTGGLYKKRIKKVVAGIGQVWGIGKRRFGKGESGYLTG